MDNVVTVIIGWILSLGAVSAFVLKYGAKADKYVKIAKEAVDLLESITSGIKDGKVDDAEVAKIRVQLVEFKEALKA